MSALPVGASSGWSPQLRVHAEPARSGRYRTDFQHFDYIVDEWRKFQARRQ